MPRKCISVSQKPQNWVLKHPEPGQDDIVTLSLAEAISRARQIDPHAVVMVHRAKNEASPAKTQASDLT